MQTNKRHKGNDMDLVQIKRRKIKARQYSQINEGKVYFKTPDGRRRPTHLDWLIEIEQGVFTFIPKHSMEFLTQKDDSEDKGT